MWLLMAAVAGGCRRCSRTDSLLSRRSCCCTHLLVTVNSLHPIPLPGVQVGKDRLIYAGLASEAAVSGYHADNIAPALMGGFILIR